MKAEQRGDGYPTLRGLLDELKGLDDAGRLRGGASRIKGGGRFRFTEGLKLGRFSWPGVGDYWVNRDQQQVIAILLEAYFECANPDVQEQTLLRAISSREPKLSRVMDEASGWGTLVIPGRGTGTFRLAAPRATSGLDVGSDDDVIGGEGAGAEGEGGCEPDEWIDYD